jgi:uncharacterized protein YmfQ (DUF2313 family)
MPTIPVYGQAGSQAGAAVTIDFFSRNNTGAFCDLLPHGAMWPRAPDTNLHRLCSAIAIDLGRTDVQIDTMLAESFPDTAQQTLTHWEAIAGLPDACDGELAATVSARQQDVVEVFTQDHVLNDAYWAALAGVYGYAAPIITKNSAFCTGINCTTDPICSLDSLLTVTFTFTSGSDDVLLECKIRKFWPDWTTLVVIFT